jgi:hypothetical protein
VREKTACDRIMVAPLRYISVKIIEYRNFYYAQFDEENTKTAELLAGLWGASPPKPRRTHPPIMCISLV